jgi:hypothetical protein
MTQTTQTELEVECPARSTREKLVYFFGGGEAEGHAGMRDVLGG